MTNTEIINKLRETKTLSDSEFSALLQCDDFDFLLHSEADKVRQQIYGKDVYIRGLIEFSNYCRNNCYYCGIRAANKNAVRYRLQKGDILDCCKDGYALGFRTFVLQSGEDMYFDDREICDIVFSIKSFACSL